MDVELVRQCADDSLTPEIVERFIETIVVGSIAALHGTNID